MREASEDTWLLHSDALDFYLWGNSSDHNPLQSWVWCCGVHRIFSIPYLSFLHHFVLVPSYNVITSTHLISCTSSSGYQNKTFSVALFFQALSTSLKWYAAHIYYSLCLPSYILILLHHHIKFMLLWDYSFFPAFHKDKSVFLCLNYLLPVHGCEVVPFVI